MSLVELPTVIAAMAALVGTTGGLLISYLTLKHTYWRDTHSIKLEIANSILVTPQLHTTKPKFSKEMMTFKVANVGAKDYTVTSLGIQVGKRSGGFYINQPFGTARLPYVLKPGNTCNFWTEWASLQKDVKKKTNRSHIKVKAYVSDYIGTSFWSNKLDMRFKETSGFKLRTKLKKTINRILIVVSP